MSGLETPERGVFEAYLGCLWGIFRASLECLRESLCVFMKTWDILGYLGASFGCLRASLWKPGRLLRLYLYKNLGVLGHHLGVLGRLYETWDIFVHLYEYLGHFYENLGVFRTSLGCLWSVFRVSLGIFMASLGVLERVFASLCKLERLGRHLGVLGCLYEYLGCHLVRLYEYLDISGVLGRLCASLWKLGRHLWHHLGRPCASFLLGRLLTFY